MTKGSEAGTALNAIMTRLTASTGPAADALEEMGISAYDSEGNFRGMEVVMKDVEKATSNMTDKEKAHYINMLAGLNHGKSFEKMLSGLGEEYDDLKDSITNSDGALKEMRDEMKDNLQGALENLSSAFEDIQIELGDALLPTIKKVTAILQSLADKFNGLDESTKQTIAKMIALTTAVLLVIGPMLLLIGFLPAIAAGFGHIWTVISTLGKGFMFLTKIIRPIITLFKLVGVAIAGLSTPVLITIAVIIAAAALIYIYWEPVKAFFLTLWDGIKEFATTAFNKIAEVVTSAWDTIKSAWDTVLDFFTNLWDSIKETATNLWDSVKTIWTGFVDTIKKIFKPLTEFFTELWGNVKSTAVDIWNNITSTLTTVWDSIKTIAGAVWDLIKIAVLTPILLLIQLLTGNMDGLRSTLTQVWEKIRAAGSKIWEALKTALSAIVEGLSNNVKSVFKFLRTTVIGIFTALKTTAINLWEQLKANLLRVANFIKTNVVDKFQQLKNDAIKKVTQTVTDMITKWKELATKTLDKMKEVVSNVIDTIKGINLKQIGKDVIDGFINGIKSKVGAVADAAKDAADAVTGKIKGILGIKSPSRVLMAMGDDTGEGYEIGILGRVKNIKKASEAMADAAKIDVNDNNLTSQIAFANNDVQRALTNDIESSVTVNKQSAMINLDLGGTSYRAFVDDITATQGYKADLVKRF